MNMKDHIRRSITASLLISLGSAVLMSAGNPIGPFLFAFGLLGVCSLKADLFTGKCGYLFLDKIAPPVLLVILVVNLLSGYLFGFLLSIANPDYCGLAADRVSAWTFDAAFFIRSVMCGVVMFLCVEVYRRGSALGILLGIPLFIFCGFQHCIANVIVLGMARTLDPSILLCIAGNFIGSLAIAYLSCSPKRD